METTRFVLLIMIFLVYFLTAKYGIWLQISSQQNIHILLKAKRAKFGMDLHA